MRLSTSILLLCSLTSFSQNSKSPKRGVAYGHHSPADMAEMSAGISWWYNWYYQPDEKIRDSYQQYGVEFVPMVWGGSFDQNAIDTYFATNDEIGFLLGFNEPNFKDQANMTPSTAAAKWPQLEALADKHGLKLIGPAVNYCGNCVSENGTTYYSPFDYLDDFFEACVDCRVDYISVHWYGCGGLDSYLKDFEKYGKPLWVTEIACWDNQTISLDQQKSYLINVVDQMESNPNVFRYAWFTGRGSGPNISLLGADGKLTELGESYINLPTHNPEEYVPVPARIEAEHYQVMSGIQLELTRDEDGFINVGYIDAADSITYNLDVPTAGKYVFDIRYAGTADGKVDLHLGDKVAKSLTFSRTGSWQSWKTMEDSIDLEAGKIQMTFKVVAGGFNLNWMDILDQRYVPLSVEGGIGEMTAYPNPTEGKLVLKLPAETGSIDVFDLSGRRILTETFENSVGDFKMDLSGHSPGVYLIKVSAGNRTYRKKLVLK